MKTWVIVVLGATIFGLFWYYRSHPLVSKVEIKGVRFVVEVAVTEAQKQKGLGGRTALAQNHGMLFAYSHKEDYNFWMRGMRFPLDFIWIDGKTIADITENVPPPKAGETPLIVKPRTPVDKILEVNAGVVKRLGVKIGDTVGFLDR